MREPVSRISVVVPTLDERAGIGGMLAALQPLRIKGHEVVVVDGGSADGTLEAVGSLADQVIRSPRGRAAQQNAGAAAARGEIFLFLHADTRLPGGADALVLDALSRSGRTWGRFDVRLSGRHPLLRIVERMISERSRLTGVATGDQAMFVRRESFTRVGGFPTLPLMEDVALSRALKRLGPPVCLRACVTTSSRRWETRGIVRTILLMWRLRLAYYLGADPHRLAERYR